MFQSSHSKILKSRNNPWKVDKTLHTESLEITKSMEMLQKNTNLSGSRASESTDLLPPVPGFQLHPSEPKLWTTKVQAAFWVTQPAQGRPNPAPWECSREPLGSPLRHKQKLQHSRPLTQPNLPTAAPQGKKKGSGTHPRHRGCVIWHTARAHTSHSVPV